MLELVTYTVGMTRDEEVMKESTANLMAATSLTKRIAIVEADYRAMLDRIKNR